MLDRILLESGVNVQSSSVSDVNRDGRADLTLNFSTGNSVALLGVNNINLVNIDQVGGILGAPGFVAVERGGDLFNHIAIA